MSNGRKNCVDRGVNLMDEHNLFLVQLICRELRSLLVTSFVLPRAPKGATCARA